MNVTAEQCRAARALLGWSQDRLAAASKVAKATIANFEAGKRIPYDRTLGDLRDALEKAGVVFIPENGGGAGVRLRKHLDAAALEQKASTLDAEAAAIHTAGPRSPVQAMAVMDKAMAKNDARRLRAKAKPRS